MRGKEVVYNCDSVHSVVIIITCKVGYYCLGYYCRSIRIIPIRIRSIIIHTDEIPSMCSKTLCFELSGFN